MKMQISAMALDNEKVRLEVAAIVRLELIHKLTSNFRDWNDCNHDEYNTGYMNCLIDTINILSEEAQDEEVCRNSNWKQRKDHRFYQEFRKGKCI